jgi:FlaA1/EpsC-like NDP-sugar epimerase
MGNPVLIKDLAETMIRNAGLRPNIDIPIIFTGRRPGEKLFEELLTAEEGTTATVNQRIYRARISRIRSYEELLDELRRLAEVAGSGDTERIRAEITRQVSSYRPDANSLNGRPTASGRAGYPPIAQVVSRGKPGVRPPESRESPELARTANTAEVGK